MKIRLTADISGLRDGAPWPARGSEVVVPDAEGADMCAAGVAVPVAEPEKPESRPAAEAEAAEKRPARRAAAK